jgi:uncharacterized protein involved in exopolysaccharide biosynthesis
MSAKHPFVESSLGPPVIPGPVAAAVPTRSSTTRRTVAKPVYFSFLELLFGRWLVIGGIFGSAVLWSYLTLARSPDTFDATGQILIRRGKLQVVQNVPILRQQEEIGSEVDILTSIAVLNEVVKHLLAQVTAAQNLDIGERELIFGTYEPVRPRMALTTADLPTTDPARLYKYLKNKFRIEKFGESNVIQVSLDSPSPAFSAEAVNALIEVYEKFNLTMEQTPGQSQYFSQEINRVDEEIDTLQSAMADFKSSYHVVDLEKQQELLALRRHTLISELDEIQVDAAALETDLDASRSLETGRVPAFLRRDEMVVKMRQDLMFHAGELAQLRSKQTEDNPLVVAKREEVEELQSKLDLEERRAISQQEHLLEQAHSRMRELESKIAEVDRLLMDYPHVAAKLDRYERDINQRTLKRMDMVEQQFTSATLENPDETMNKVKVVSYAPLPALAVEARKGFKFLVAVVFSLILAFVAAGFIDNIDHTIRKREQIEDHLDLPHLASVSNHIL